MEGGVLPAPPNRTDVLLITSDCVTGPSAVGVKVIGNVVDWPAVREIGESDGTEKGGRVATSDSVVVDVPEFVTVNITCSDWLILRDGKTTSPLVPSDTVTPPEAYEKVNCDPCPVPARTNVSLPTCSVPFCGPTCVGVYEMVKFSVSPGFKVGGTVGWVVIANGGFGTAAMELMVPFAFPVFVTVTMT